LRRRRTARWERFAGGVGGDAGALDDLGVLEPVLAAGAVPLDRFTLVNEDVRIDGTVQPPQFATPGLCVRRVTLDALLVDAAAAAGTLLREAAHLADVDTIT
jgi:menaquinone-9 beta-reductase